MDFYAVLGVTRSASRPEVERAYRRLARRYHPGINPGDRVAEALFQQIQEAFAVLGDVDRRRSYDAGGREEGTTDPSALAFDGFDFSKPADTAVAATFSELFADVFQDAAREATTPSRGADIVLGVDLSFEQAVRGGTVPLSVTRLEICHGCDGGGAVARQAALCAACQGSGVRRWARGHMVFSRPCESCEGQGRLSAETCRSCRGGGVVPRTEVVTLSVPAGVESGTRLAVPGRGHAGARGGPVGDLYLTLSVAPHRFYRREGRDLHVTLPVAVAEAVLGGLVDVPTLEGTAIVEVPPGVGGSTEVRIAGLGVPGDGTRPAGDMVVRFTVVVPEAVDDRSRELIREFARRNPVDVRHDLFVYSGRPVVGD